MLDGSPPGLAAPLSASTFTHTLLTGRLALLLVLAAALHSSPGVAEEPPAQAMAAFLLHLSGGPMRVGMSEDGGPTTWRNRGWRGAIAVEVQRLDGDTVRVTVTLGEAGGKRVIKAGDIRRGESVVISPPVDIEADYFGAGNWPLRIEYLGNWT